MEPKLNIELSATHIQNLGALLDLAVKSGGMQAAKAALPIQEVLEAAAAQFNASNAPRAAAAETEEGHA
jgi:hypothetical protein